MNEGGDQQGCVRKGLRVTHDAAARAMRIGTHCKGPGSILTDIQGGSLIGRIPRLSFGRQKVRELLKLKRVSPSHLQAVIGEALSR